MKLRDAVQNALVEMRPNISRGRVNELEDHLRRFEQVDVPIVHHFSQGVYAREMRLPRGTLITGKIHKHRQLNILSAGEVSVLVEGRMQRVRAPYTVVAEAGAKRIMYAHTDAVWTVIHGTDETDLEKIEAHFVAQDEAEYRAHLALEAKKGEPCLG